MTSPTAPFDEVHETNQAWRDGTQIPIALSEMNCAEATLPRLRTRFATAFRRADSRVQMMANFVEENTGNNHVTCPLKAP